MTDTPRIDPESLAALVDGRLSGPEREKLITKLADSDADVELLADVAAAVSAAEPRVVPIHQRTWMRPLMVAAAIVVIVAPLAYMQMAGRNAIDSREFAAAYVSAGGTLPSDWSNQTWAITRGEGDTAVYRALSARIGSRLTDLEIASRTNDTSVAQVVAEIGAMLDAVPGGGVMSTPLNRVTTTPAADRENVLAEIHRAARSLLYSEALDLGSWVEAARLAAARRDAAFFASRASKRLVERTAGRNEYAGFDQISALTSPPSIDWDALGRSISSFAATITR